MKKQKLCYLQLSLAEAIRRSKRAREEEAKNQELLNESIKKV